MLSVWALRARSYKTKEEAWQQGIALHPPQGVFLVFVLLPVRGERREWFKEFKWFKWFKEFKRLKGFCSVLSVFPPSRYRIFLGDKHNLRGNVLCCNQARGDAAQVMSVCSDLPLV